MHDVRGDELLCENCVKHLVSDSGGSTIVECPYCGNYQISSTLSGIINTNPKYKNKRKILSVMVRRGWEYGKKSQPFQIHTKIADDLINEYEGISVEDRINYLVDYLGKETSPGDYIDIEKASFASYSIKDEQNRYFRDYLEKIGLAEKNGWKMRLTPEGWERYADVDAKINSNVCFIAMSFTNEDVENDYKAAIEPLLIEKLNFHPIVIRDVEHNKDAVYKIKTEIHRCRFLIADVRDFKTNVYYEAGYAMGLNKEVIWLCHKDCVKDLDHQFDTRNLNHIIWKDREDLKEKLENRIKATVLTK